MAMFIPRFWEAVGVITGMIIGSGMFAIPYAVTVSGLWRAGIYAVLASFAILAIHLAYGEVVSNSEEAHRLPGFIRKHFGLVAGRISGFTQILSFNVTLLIYGILGGKFLSVIIGRGSAEQWTIIFFFVCAIIFYIASIRSVGFLNLLLTIPLMVAILFISGLAWRSGSLANIIAINGTDSFFSFSVFMFALAGLSVIADAKSAFKNEMYAANKLRNAIIVGTSIPIFLYVIFTAAVLSVSGTHTSPDALSGLIPYLGNKVVFVGALAGFLAVITSYLALGYDLRKIYELDFSLPAFMPWFLASFAPLIVFTAGATNFIKLISLVGGLFIVIDGIFVVFILRKMRKSDVIRVRFLPFNALVQVILIVLFVASAVFEVLYQIQ